MSREIAERVPSILRRFFDGIEPQAELFLNRLDCVASAGAFALME